MNWLWLNMPLMAVFFLAMAGIPLWLVFKHPDTGPVPALGVVPRPPEPVAAVARARDLAGASR